MYRTSTLFQRGLLAMKYSLPAIALFALASAASAQIIHEPVRYEVYNPYYEKLNLQAIHRLRTLQEPAPVINVFVTVDGREGKGEARDVRVQRDAAARVPGFYGPAADSVSFDPRTGEPLYFRMADVLPPVAEADRGDSREAQERRGRARDGELGWVPPGAGATTTTAPADPPNRDRQPTQTLEPLPGMAKKGEIIIKPYRPRR
jgi:hypothetical protein